jgi:hypothetical protein
MLDLPARFDEIGAATRVKVSEDFGKYGLELADFFINAITPPEEVQKAIDARSSMGAIGDLRAFTMYQAANSMSKMAEQGGGGTGSNAMGMGMGAGFGMMMPGMIQQAMHGMQQKPPASPGAPAAAASGLAAGAAASAQSGGLNFDDLGPPTDPQGLVRNVAQSAGWQIQESGDQWQITVPIGSLRKQTVLVDFAARDDEGHQMIAYSSVCGPASDRAAMALLRYNQRMVHGAFAVNQSPSGEVVVVVANQLADTADPLEVTRLVTAVAWQADKAEQKLTGDDAN